MALGRVVLDTDVVIDFLRGHGTGVQPVRRMLSEGRALLSAVSAFELRQGARKPEDRDVVEAFCRNRTVPLTLQAALHAGDIGAQLRAAGIPIGPADTLIAGMCRHHGYALVTGNVAHFNRVPDLDLIAPA